MNRIPRRMSGVSPPAGSSSTTFRRVRIGIGHPGHKDKVLRYVLQDFAKADDSWLDPLLDAMAEAAPILANGDDAAFASKVALILKPPEHKPRPQPAVSDGE